MTRLPQAKPASLSRPLDAKTIGDGGVVHTIVANEAERDALAALVGIVAIDALSADLKIRREGDAGLRVTGEVVARVRQTCVVTLDDFDTELVEPVDVRFLPLSDIEAEATRRAKIVPGPGAEPFEDDLPDPIVNGRIDLGALAGEFLALGLDPYPKKPGTTFEAPEFSTKDDAAVSPFAVLAHGKTP